MRDAMPDVTARLLGLLSDRFAKTPESPAAESPERWSYREAASVLHCFNPAALRPADLRLAVSNPRALLLGDTVPATGGRDSGFHTLKPEVRQAALRRLGSRERLRATLAANPERPMTDVQRMLEACLDGSEPPLEKQSNEELSQTLQVVSWLGEVVAGLPTEAAVREHLSRRSVLRPFEHLVRRSLVGRDKDLARLRDYVGALPPDSLVSSAVRYFRSFLSVQPALLLFGPGGIGKSALVGRFLYEHSQAPPELRFPFAYLTFDNPLLQAGEPYTLLVEAADQLARQYPEQASAHETFRRQIEIYRNARAGLGGRASRSQSRRGKLDEVGALDLSLFKDFGALLRELAGVGGGTRPALLVLDTFEEVQYRPVEELVGLGRMLGALQDHFPNLRIVASGRAPADGLRLNGARPTPMPLGELDAAAAVRLLEIEGVGDADLARTLARQLPGNPLTLKLAARAVAGGDDLESLSTRRFLVFAVSPELILGQLYRRVLAHIHDEDVKKLAHPGMVLRRVTPEVILEVLSQVCGVELKGMAEARRLFSELRQEHSLVRLENDGVLQFRPEVRQPMLRLLEREKPAQVREIHEAAVRYWSRQEGVAARAEELYHRLALDQEPWELDGRWLPEAGTSLVSSRDELPPRAVAWLASHMSLALDPKTRAAAGLADWERVVGRQAVNLLRYQAVEPALKLLAERTERSPGSALYSLEARAHLLADHPPQAVEVLERGLDSMPITGNPGRLAEMLWLHAQATATLGKLADADASLARAEVVAREIADPLCRLQILTQRLLLLRRGKGSAHGAAAVLRDVLAHDLSLLDAEQMDRERVLVRIAVAELGPEHLPVVRRAIEAVGIGSLVNPQTEPSLRSALAGEGPPAPADQPLGSLIRKAFQETRRAARAAEAVIAALRSEDLSLDAANLAGIEEYRERWELEISTEASV
jgi:hypothetical protein